jgi:hypothetical protein
MDAPDPILCGKDTVILLYVYNPSRYIVKREQEME